MTPTLTSRLGRRTRGQPPARPVNAHAAIRALDRCVLPAASPESSRRCFAGLDLRLPWRLATGLAGVTDRGAWLAAGSVRLRFSRSSGLQADK